VVSVHKLADIVGASKEVFKESDFALGYILASLGRGLMHGHDQNIGEAGIY
jgi:hypothetical protein